MKLLAIIGSQRKDGNSYLLAKEALESVQETDYEIIQLVEKKIEFCNLCAKCKAGDCVLKDDFNQILDKIQEADGIVFSFPKYFSLSSKFLCFLERLVMIHHCKEYHGPGKTGKPDQNFSPPFKGKPYCIFVVSASGKGGEEPLRLAAYEIERIGMKLILHDSGLSLEFSQKEKIKEKFSKIKKALRTAER
ncbi:MAG: flavodoxin family protein [Candidatus Bathyarchaeota archaeon]|nr:flavodoxin family protein [Candidatus Bathyarchaeota archaeon]